MYLHDSTWMDLAASYANSQSGCQKVKVGALIVMDKRIISMGANKAIPNICKGERGCLRVEKYGEDTKNHRNPDDCRAIHSEIDAICNAWESTRGATMYITRYPCEACARAIVSAGISKVIYGREQAVSHETQRIFEIHKVDCIHYFDYQEADKVQ